MSSNEVAAIKRLVGTEKDIFSHCDWKYYTSVARAIQVVMPCLIHFRTSTEPEFKDQAQTWSRTIQVTVKWPQNQTFYRPEHYIIYDEEMAKPENRPAAAARCIAHELFHILAHEPTSIKRKCDQHGRVKYTKQEEEDADIFSLLLLSNRQYIKTRSAPISFEELERLLKQEAGKPHYLTWAQIRALEPHLDWKQARNR